MLRIFSSVNMLTHSFSLCTENNHAHIKHSKYLSLNDVEKKCPLASGSKYKYVDEKIVIFLMIIVLTGEDHIIDWKRLN